MYEKYGLGCKPRYIIEKSHDNGKWELCDNVASEELAMLLASYYARTNCLRYRYRPAITLCLSEITTSLERH
jgi:hypothetical protein